MSHHSHSPVLAHHFEDLEQQHETNVLGMWTFLLTEVMFFGGLFLSYIIMRTAYPDVFREASHHLDVVLGTVNTTVLLMSSLTMVLAVRATQLGRRKQIVMFILLTMLLGSIFLGIKGVEYYHKYEDHLIPGLNFMYEGEANPRVAQMFFGLYFTMTGMHALHMIIGILVLAYFAVGAWRNRYPPEGYAPIEMMALYWHFVDIIWVFLFPLLYLIGRH